MVLFDQPYHNIINFVFIHCLIQNHNILLILITVEGAQWLSGKVLDLRPKGRSASLCCGP